jgi:hypothetical protein
MMEDRRLTPANFKRDEPLVSRRYQTINGVDHKPGDPIDPDLPFGVRMRMWLTARAVYASAFKPTPVIDPAEEARINSTIEPLGGGYYRITTPWLPDGERVRGGEAAKARLDELLAAGDPKGVAIEGGEGGWYTITVAWLAEPEKVQGEEAAQARAAELREAGPPAGFDPSAGPGTPALLGSDGFDDSYTIGDDEIQLGQLVADAFAASGLDLNAWNDLAQDGRDAQIRAELDRRVEAAKPAPTGAVSPEGPDALSGGGLASGEAAIEPVQPTDFTFEESGSNGYFTISGPGLDTPVKVRGAEARDAKLAELREAAGIKAPETPPADAG